MNSDTAELTKEINKAVADCNEWCCVSPAKPSPEEAAARKAKRQLSYDNAVRLLHFAEKAALDSEPEQAKALTDIANAWDSLAY